MNVYQQQGYEIVEGIFSDNDVSNITRIIDSHILQAKEKKPDQPVYAYRKFLQRFPAIRDKIFTTAFLDLLQKKAGADYAVVKSIYFDKPAGSNWFVAGHQDLTVSVKEKHSVDGFGPWSQKEGYFAVQPPEAILRNNITFRIHLNTADENNGCLQVVPGSHREGIIKDNAYYTQRQKTACVVPAGAVMIMSPLLMHGSQRSKNGSQRRVIHIEFSNASLPEPLAWEERLTTPFTRD